MKIMICILLMLMLASCGAKQHGIGNTQDNGGGASVSSVK